jgi:hypothetical protein
VLFGALFGAVGPSFAAGVFGHSAAPAKAPSAAGPSLTPAAQGQDATGITIGVVYTPGVIFPGNVTFWTNISKGAISDTTTWAWVAVNGTGTGPLVATLNGTVNTAKVVSFTNNGILYENYTWVALVDQTTLTCTDASCSTLIGATGFGHITFTINVKENGASEGGGWATASDAWWQPMQSTFPTVAFTTPATNLSSGAAWRTIQALPLAITFTVNASYLVPSNLTTFVTLTVDFKGTPVPGSPLNLSRFVNSTNAKGYSSSMIFNGTIGGVPYGEVAYSLVLNYTSLGYTSQALMATALGQGGTLTMTPSLTLKGAGAGGINTPVTVVFVETLTSGTTLIYGTTTDAPIPYQVTPYTETGWVNLSWVNAVWKTNGNTTVKGFFQVWGATLLSTLSVNNSVNTTNAAQVSLTPLKNGTTSLGIQFTNYSWSVVLTTADLGASPYGDAINMSLNLTIAGLTPGGVTEYLHVPALFKPGPFVEHPTVVTVTPSKATPITGFIKVPYNLNFTIAVTNGTITAANTVVTVTVMDPSLPYGPAAISASTVMAVADSQTAYTYPITSSTTTCTTPALYDGTGAPVCVFSAPTDPFYFTISVTENGIGAPTNGSVASYSVNVGPAFFVTISPSLTLLAPRGFPGPTTLSTGNVTFTTLYSGQFISSVTLTVTSGTVTVFTALMTQVVAGVPVTAVWPATVPGVYSLSIKLLRTSGPPIYTNETLNLIQSGGGLVHQNSTSWHNVTLLGSLAPAVAGTILLVVGLLVGMIVALLAGRMVWGGAKKEPPQAWTPAAPEKGEGEGTAGPPGTSGGPPPS